MSNFNLHPTGAASYRRIFFLLLAALTSGFLHSQTHTVSGHVAAGFGTGVATGVHVVAFGATGPVQEVVTDASGQYTLTLPAGSDYTIRALHDSGYPNNGVTTFDIVFTRQHILQQTPFDTPLKMIAADADLSGNLDTFDLVAINRTILGIESLPISWRMVIDQTYQFPNALTPSPVQATIEVTDLTTDLTDVNFRAIKLGDVNGSWANTLPGDENIALENPIYDSNIRGQVQLDANLNCLADSAETGLASFLVRAISETNPGASYAAFSNQFGNYNLNCPPGTYTLVLTAPNELWTLCNDTVPGLTVAFGQDAQPDFAVQAAIECPALEVNLGTWGLRRCFSNWYTVNYCNTGSATAVGAYVEVTLDPFFIYTSSSIPYSAVNGQTYTFPVGDVGLSECGSFTIHFDLSCDATLGQTHCTTAHAFPDSLCVPPGANDWGGANLEVTGECTGDSVVFTITNVGGPMTQMLEYVVIEDVMIQMTAGNLLLGAGESTTVSVPANGSTWRMEVNQPDDNPFSQWQSAAVEGCGTNPNGTFSLGFITQFPQDDQALAVDEDCRENQGSYDPNDKQGFPVGTGEEHYILPDQPIDYLIRFQNTGTDTAFTVVVVDTLPAEVDLTTFRAGVASHPYLLEVLEGHVLRFTFLNILLPDSNVNEAASHGFVRFSIQPRKWLPFATVIRNSAAIYFDFNLPVITNQTWHTLSEGFLSHAVVLPDAAERVQVSPNPFSQQTVFSLTRPVEAGVLRLYTAQGRLVQTQRFAGQQLTLHGGSLPEGVYFYALDLDGVRTAVGRVVVVK
jgi:uncharacterized repeat protein (TIGR01451 family)